MTDSHKKRNNCFMDYVTYICTGQRFYGSGFEW